MYIKTKRVFFAMSIIGVLTAALSLATSGISKSYSQNTNAYCLGFRQDYGSIIDCFVSDNLCQEYAKDLAHDVSILTPCHESER